MGKQSTPAPAQYYQPAPQPTAADSLAEQIKLQPELLAARQQYDPQFNALDFQQLQQYTPLVNDLMAAEQQRLSPNQYALNEDLAAQALAGSKADLPALMKQSALDTYRSEIGSNVGSPIGAEYTSRNLAQLGEQYRNNYQNMGLSLLNKFPTPAQSATPQGAQSFGQQSLTSAYGNNISAYGAYNNAMANSFYQPAPSSRGNMMGTLIGGGIGAVAGNAMMPGMGGFLGAGLGSSLGGQFCWVANEVFGGWENPKTLATRMFLICKAPEWFRDFYASRGQKIAEYIHNKPILKSILRPLFEVFAFLGGK